MVEELQAVMGAGTALEGTHPGLRLIDVSTVRIAASRTMAATAFAGTEA